MLEQLLWLIDDCETAGDDGQRDLIWRAALAAQHANVRVRTLLELDAFMQAAIEILPAGASWRKFVDQGCSVYAASPFNAAAQVRYDGHGDIDSLSLCAAHLRLLHAKEAKAQALLARKSPAASSPQKEGQSALSTVEASASAEGTEQ